MNHIRISPMGFRMLFEEAREGRQPIYPTNAPAWLIADDWEPWPVLALARDELHIIAVWSARPGAFRRLIDGCRKAGLHPVVVGPFAHMKDILVRWGWRKSIRGMGYAMPHFFHEEWRPETACQPPIEA